MTKIGKSGNFETSRFFRFHQFSPNFPDFHQFSPNSGKRDPENLGKSKFHQIFLIFTKCHQMSPEFSPNLGKSEKSRKNPGICNFPRNVTQILLNKGGIRLTQIFALFCTPASAFTDEKNSFRKPAFSEFSAIWWKVKNLENVDISKFWSIFTRFHHFLTILVNFHEFWSIFTRFHQMSPEFSPNLGKSGKSRKHPGISNFPRISPKFC